MRMMGIMQSLGQRISLLLPSRSENATRKFEVRVVNPNLDLFLIAVCLGVLTGVAEAGIDFILSLIPDQLGWRNDLVPTILWVAPIFNLLLFMALSVPVMLAARFLKRVRPDLLAYAVFGWLACFGAVSASKKIDPLASAILATGVTFQVVLWARKRQLTRALLTRSALAALVLLLLMSIAALGLGLNKAYATGAAAAVVSRSPNVLLITLDTLPATELPLYGYSRETTPNLDRLAGEGVLFEDVLATANWTLPSHASIMTGRFLYEHQANNGPLNARYPTLAEYLASRGYVTGGFVGNTLFGGRGTGLARGFRTYEDYFSNVVDMGYRTFYGGTLSQGLPFFGFYNIPGRKSAAEVNREFLQWLDGNDNLPFFAFLNYFDVHDPYIPPAPYRTKFTDSPGAGNRVNSHVFGREFTNGIPLSPAEILIERNDYDGALAYTDSQLGILLDRLKAAGVLDNTLLIITADHGESFGNHGLYGHGNSLYRDLLHVPMVIRYPGHVPSGQSIKCPVSLRQIPSTVLNLLGLVSNSPFPGSSLSAEWERPSSEMPCSSEPVFSEAVKGRIGAIKSLTTADWQLIVHQEGNVELYRIDRDPQEADNLAASPQGKQVIEQLGSSMQSYMTPDDWKIFSPFISSSRQ